MGKKGVAKLIIEWKNVCQRPRIFSSCGHRWVWRYYNRFGWACGARRHTKWPSKWRPPMTAWVARGKDNDLFRGLVVYDMRAIAAKPQRSPINHWIGSKSREHQFGHKDVVGYVPHVTHGAPPCRAFAPFETAHWDYWICSRIIYLLADTR